MRRRLNTKKIIRNRDIDGLSKKETELPENMKQRFSDEKIAILEKKLKEWKTKNQ